MTRFFCYDDLEQFFLIKQKVHEIYSKILYMWKRVVNTGAQL